MIDFLIALPKSGTNMMDRIIGGTKAADSPDTVMLGESVSHPRQQMLRKLRNLGRFTRVHLPYHVEYAAILRDRGLRTFFISRDPRDVAVSAAYWNSRTADLSMEEMDFSLAARDEGTDDLLLAEILQLAHLYTMFMPWLREDWVNSFSYESIVKHDEDALNRLKDILGIGIDQVKARIADRSTATFRKGTVGDWREHFTQQHKQVFNSEMSEIMERLGYD